MSAFGMLGARALAASRDLLNLRAYKSKSVPGLVQGIGALAVVMISAPAISAPLSYANAVLADNPFAYYRLGEGSGTTASDATAGARDGTYVGSPNLGVPGDGGDTAVEFDGTNDFMQVPDLDVFGTLMGSFSIEAIFKTTTTQFGSITSSFSSSIGNTGFAMRVNANTGATGGTGTAFFVRDNNGTAISGNFTNDIYDGLFHHVVMTYDQSGATAADRLKAYVDGVLQPLNYFFTGAPSNFLTLDQAVGIAATQATPPTGQDFFDGTIDEIAYYGGVLSANQVAAHAAALAPSPVPLPAAFPLLGGGIALMGLLGWRRKRKPATA